METDDSLTQILRHIDGMESEPARWFRLREEYITRLRECGLDLWSPVKFVLPSLLEPAGDDPEAFAALSARACELILRLDERGIPRTRTEQYGIRSAADAVEQALIAGRTRTVIGAGHCLASRLGGGFPGCWVTLRWM